MTTSRSPLVALASLAVLMAGLTTGASASSPSTVTARSRALPTPTTATVTPDQLGANSVIAVVGRGNFDNLQAKGLRRSLEVITPDGARHPVYSVALAETPSGWHPGDFVLADWRPELRTALLSVSLGMAGTRAVSYDLTTGATRQVDLPSKVMAVGLDPTGAGLVVTTYGSAKRSGRVGLLSWDGVRTNFAARSTGAGTVNPSGSTIVTTEGDKHQWWVVDRASGSARTVPTPGDCTALRWTNEQTLMADCVSRRGSQLMSLGLDGTRAPLGVLHRTTRRRFQGPAWNDTDVRTVQGRGYYESNGPCGGSFITKQSATGKVRMVKVPKSTAGVDIVSSRGEALVIAHTETCDLPPPRAVLSLFNPVTKAETVLTRLGTREHWREVRAATEITTWGW